ncbi:MAG: hypothetical protein V1779_16690 [bacterium]
MNHLQNIVIWFFVLVLGYNLTAQEKDIDFNSDENILKFANFLFDSGEFYRAANEYERFLFIKDNRIDSIEYRIGLCNFFDDKLEKSISNFKNTIDKSDDFSIKVLALFHSVYALNKLNLIDQSVLFYNNNRATIFKERKPDTRFDILLASNNLLLKNWDLSRILINNFPDKGDYSKEKVILNKLLEKGIDLKEKNPYLAAGLSTIIPGLGKVYTGKTIDGLFTFLLLGFTTWQAYDGFADDGTASIKGWLFSGIGTVFYLGNIYGSYIAVKIKNKEMFDEYNTQIHIELRKIFGY